MKQGRLLTSEDYRQLPDEPRCQLVEGGLVMEPSPSFQHQDVVLNLATILRGHILEHGLGKLAVAPLDVYLSLHNVLQPDLLFVAAENRKVVAADGVHGAPDLVVEVLSPSNARLDIRTKRRLCAVHGVREMWLVDPVLAQVQRYDFAVSHEKPVDLLVEGEAFVSPLLPGLIISVSEIFRAL